MGDKGKWKGKRENNIYLRNKRIEKREEKKENERQEGTEKLMTRKGR